ncbi:MAG: ATPase domain-containing protein [Halobacteriota archaeon]|nr:ATPase domain-containing protein [Halobacteriota archaeon]
MQEETKNTIGRVPIGIEGFDELCNGGLLRNRTYLISGTSGAGKTIFCLQYLYNGIVKFGECGILIATEERPKTIRENAMTFGWDLKELEDEGKLVIVDATSAKLDIESSEKYVDVRPFDMKFMVDQIINIQDEMGAKRAVVDSSTSIGFYINDPAKIRIELLKLSVTMEMLGLTTLFTCEIVDETNPNRFGVENFVTEGTIAMYYKRIENERVHSLEIYKMRGSSHSKKLHPFDIASEGIRVHPHDEIYDGF